MLTVVNLVLTLGHSKGCLSVDLGTLCFDLALLTFSIELFRMDILRGHARGDLWLKVLCIDRGASLESGIELGCSLGLRLHEICHLTSSLDPALGFVSRLWLLVLGESGRNEVVEIAWHPDLLCLVADHTLRESIHRSHRLLLGAPPECSDSGLAHHA